jgi:hypothetical protein
MDTKVGYALSAFIPSLRVMLKVHLSKSFQYLHTYFYIFYYAQLVLIASVRAYIHCRVAAVKRHLIFLHIFESLSEKRQ